MIRMRPALILAVLAALPATSTAQTIFINEIHYDDAGVDQDEGVEVAGPAGTNLAGWTLVGYNGNPASGAPYSTTNLTGTIPSQQNGYGTRWFPIAGLQNGNTAGNEPDGIALVDDQGSVVQFLSYEGSFVAVGGPADGMTSEDIGVEEAGNEIEGSSLQLIGTGVVYNAFTWTGPTNASPDAVNVGQTFPNVTVLNVDNVSLQEGDAGTVNFVFTMSLSQVPAGTVTFDATIDDGTATVADGDYVDQNNVAKSITPPATTTTFTVQVNGDVDLEGDETFFVRLTNIVGATAGDVEGLGTILNDDTPLTAIHDIQGPGASSPVVGQAVTTEGLVTARRSNGFFLQAPDAEADANPATSEGIFVFTSAAPPASAPVGARVQVSGTVVEFVPAADPQQPPLTEISAPTVVQLAPGPLPLPTPVALSATFPDPAGVHDQMERVEGMRVTVPSFTVTAPTLGSINEVNATATTNGVLFGTVTGVPRAFREPGVQLPDALPAGSPANVPRFDTNPEVIRVDTDGQVPPAPWSPLDARTGAVINGLTGVVDYAFRTYTILPDPVAAAVTPGPGPSPVTPPAAGEVTVASFNLLRLFDTVNDPTTSDPVLTPAAFDRRLSKLSLAVRDYLLLPDVVAVQEVENLTTLEALAGQINADVIAGGSPSPEYVAYLTEGNDVGGIDVGFLVRTAPVNPPSGPDRVAVTSVTQIGAASVVVDPDPNQPNTDLLNDRPPLVLQAIVNQADGSQFPLTVLVVHQRSLNGIASEEPETACCGWTTVGQRVRAKRFQQANFLGAWLQTRQTTGAAETRRVLVLGDFNAFAFNDGFVDTMGFLTAMPAPNDQTVIPADGFSTLSPGLFLASDSGAGQGYSYTFDGDAQSIDHALATAALASVAGVTVDHARVDADFPVVSYGVDATAERASDHDPLLVVLVPILFRDGFETGDTTLWSAAQP